MTSSEASTTPLRDWAATAYAAPGAEAALLALQDNHGQCVCYLLWTAWCAKTSRSPDAATVKDAAVLAARWEQQVSGPLRVARRALKAAWPGVSDEDRQSLRARIKADELQAEQLLLDAFEALGAGDDAAGGGDVAAALKQAAAAWTPPAPAIELDRLARIFETLRF